MRTFVAINLANRPRNFLAKKVSILKNEINTDLKWVDELNWHVTLKFLGNIKLKDIDKIKDIMKEVTEEGHQFYLQIRGIDAFPHINNPRIVYTGIERGSKRIVDLHNKLVNKFINFGIVEETKEKYIPHITLARTRKEVNNTNISRIINKYNKQKYFINISMKVEKISLMKSELFPDGPKYEEIYSVKL